MPSSLPALPLEDVARYPAPGFIQPVSVAFSPDDRLITFLHSPEGSLTRQLYVAQAEGGEPSLFVSPPQGGTTEQNVSLEEALRRERERQMGTGVTVYTWAEKGQRLLIPLPDGVYVQAGLNAPLIRILERGAHPILDARFSPDGEWIAYVQDAELYVIPAAGGTPRQITSGARGAGKTNGLAEFVAQEEMGRRRGYWWSPDSRWLAFAEVDETHIPIYRITHQGKDAVGEGAQEDHHYPFAGQANAKVRLGVVSRDGDVPVWMDLGEAEYLARAGWLPDGRVWAQLQNREQTQLDLVTFDPRRGTRSLLLRETSEVWINLHDLFHPLRADHPRHPGGFIWASERSGFRHLYLYDRQGQLLRTLTSGDWMVDALAGVDEGRATVYFTAARESPLESHLYAVSLDGGEPRRLTQEPGAHAVCLDHRFQRFVDTHDSLTQPPTLTLRSLADGSLIRPLFAQTDPRVGSLQLAAPEIVSLSSRDGARLYGALYRPPSDFGPGPHPAIVSVYGGPHAQMVANAWRVTAAMRAQYLSRLGYLVFVLDNRGSARRGLAFEGALRHALGHVEVDDQVDGVRWLIQQGLADPARVGIYGWSYGGYMAAMCLARAPEVFKLAVAGAPVTHWDGYDTHYTERYLGLPGLNPEGYRVSSVMHHVDRLTGKLLLVHGLIDENVHFRHTARLINALIQARKPYELLLFPDERHSPRRLADRVFMEEQIRDFIRRHL